MTAVDICNMALARIGQRSITTMEDVGTEAGFCRQFYNRTRRLLLRQYPWRFALRSEAMVRSLDALGDPLEDVEWEYVCDIPATSLRLVDIRHPRATAQIPYELQGENILLNHFDADNTPSETQVRYVADVGGYTAPVIAPPAPAVDDADMLDDAFIDAFVCRLAADLAMPITGDPAKQVAMLQLFTAVMPTAQAASATEARKYTRGSETLAASRF